MPIKYDDFVTFLTQIWPTFERAPTGATPAVTLADRRCDPYKKKSIKARGFRHISAKADLLQTLLPQNEICQFRVCAKNLGFKKAYKTRCFGNKNIAENGFCAKSEFCIKLPRIWIPVQKSSKSGRFQQVFCISWGIWQIENRTETATRTKKSICFWAILKKLYSKFKNIKKCKNVDYTIVGVRAISRRHLGDIKVLKGGFENNCSNVICWFVSCK